MSKAHNKHFHLNLPTSIGSKLIKFSYFFLVLLVVSCGDAKSKKAIEGEQSEKQSEENETTDANPKTILCFGDSITAGYGLDDGNDGYPAVLQQKIDSLNLDYTVINSGVSGETSAGGKSRIEWVIKQDIDFFLLELGANDGLRGVPLSETRSNLQSIIDAVQKKNPEIKIILAGMELPPNMGKEYTTGFRQLYADLAKKNKVAFIPFILKDVGGIASLNQSDGIHPTIEGHKILANTVWETLKPLLEP